MALQNLLLLRHGEAHHGSPDDLRELSEEGYKEVIKSLSKAANKIPAVDLVFHSGLVRAMQTADIAVQQLALDLHPQYLEGISPWGDPTSFCKNLRTEQLEVVMVVTHNPFVEDLAEYLTGETMRIKTGSLVCLDVDFLERGCCNLAWIQH